MSLLTPERVPVKIYKWDDAGAPALDKTAGCMMTIFKACLVTGYGTKEPTGWTMPFEDTTAKVKVFRPPVSPNTDFYLRCSADTGKQMTSQVYFNMTAQNAGALKLQCASPFKYATTTNSGKWILIASTRGFWFFCEQTLPGSNTDKTGSYFFVGDTAKRGVGARDLYLQHTGGNETNGVFSTLFGRYGESVYKAVGVYNSGKVLLGGLGNAINTDLSSLSDGTTDMTNTSDIAPVFCITNKLLSVIPGLFVPLNGAMESNFTVKNIAMGDRNTQVVSFGTGSHTDANVYISTDEWVY